jgi:uncharacterized membrane protein YdbT with pleckstrin-like domain
MAYPDELLVEGEQVVIHRHPHWKMLVLPVIAFLATVGVAVYLAALVRDQSWAPIAWIAIAALAVVLEVWLTMLPLLRWWTTHFVVTTRRVLVREGVLSRQGIDIPMTRINTVQFRHTMIERMLGCGTLVIESASDEPLEFDDIPGVEKVHSVIYSEMSDPRDGRQWDDRQAGGDRH